ncbi:MAG: ATP-dependent Clp protease proteolytic subunit [Clostridia bacterium]|nr:ATP-dependent Clp protease proteolytic subunit [Clostridia bacterium]
MYDYDESEASFFDELQVAPPVAPIESPANPVNPNAPKVPGNIPIGSPMESGFVTVIPNGERKKYVCNIDWFVGKPDPYMNITHILYTAEPGDEVVFNLYSYGGSVETGCMIINAIKNTKATVTTVAFGLCASIAAMIWSCGHIREVMPTATIMYHMPSGMVFGKTADNEEESRHIQGYFSEFMREVTKGILTEDELDKIINKRMDMFIPAATIQARLAVTKEENTNE